MNTPRIIEQAIKQVAQEMLPSVPRLWLRASRNQTKALDDNGTEGNEAFPQLVITASTKYYTNPFATYGIDITFDVYTDIDADEDGTQLSDIEESLEGLLDGISCNGSTENARFVELVQELIPEFHFGAFYADGGGGTPTYMDDCRTLSQTLTLHYSV